MRSWCYALWGVVAAIMLINVAIGVATSDLDTFGFTTNFLRGAGLDANDSWGPMRAAIEQLRAHPQAPVYTEVFFTEKIKFQYPLSSLLPLDLVQRFSHLSWDTVISALNRLSWYSIWASGFIAWRLLVGSLRRAQSPSGRPTAATIADELTLLWPCLALTMLFYPLMKSYALGQIQTLMTLLGVGALLLWQSNRKILAGLCIGACCAVKPQWAVLIAWALLRREWQAAAAAFATFGVLVAAAGAAYGFQNLVDYVGVLSYLGQRGEVFFPNQSVNGLLNRLYATGNSLVFDIHGFPEYHVTIYAVTAMSSALILGGALLYRRKERADVRDLALTMLSATMASPIAWEHHYSILLAIFAVAAPAAIARKAWGPATGAWLVLAYVVASQRLDVTNHLANTPFNFVQSYLFLAAVAVLILLYRVAHAPAEMPDAATG